MVDDVSFMREMLKSILQLEGYRIAGEAANGRQAVDLYREVKPDVVLMDIVMPVMDGFEAAAIIRAADPGAKIVFCTALTQKDAVIKAVNLKAAGFIAKPFTPDMVLEALRKATA